MAIVISYPVGTTTLSTMLLGSQYDSETGVAITKNFSVGSISNLILSLIPPGVDSVFGRIGDVLAVSGDYTTSLVTEGTNLYYTDVRAREAITLTTIGASGAATYNNVSGVLNIPQYSGGSGIAWLESNATDLTVWNNGQGNVASNISFGDQALRLNTTGFQNAAYGTQSLGANTDGNQNTAIGYNTLVFNASGAGNTATGAQSLYSNLAGNNNTANGIYSLRNTTLGSNNSANGYHSLRYNTTGENNTGSGAQSILNNTTGNNNSGFGVQALENVGTGNSNTAIGYQAGGNATATSTSNVYIGALSGPTSFTNESNKLYIANAGGTPLIGGDFVNKIVTINQVLVLTPTIDAPIFPGGAVNGMIAVYGVGAAQHIYCYINGAWKQLDN
jgi:hypothetical protein